MIYKEETVIVKLRLRQIGLVTSIIVILLFLAPNNLANGAEVKSEYLILYDVANGQKFTLENMTGAAESLAELESRFNTKIIIQELTATANETNLQGVDLLILTNPEKDTAFSSKGKLAIQELVGQGGGVLFMSNPLARNVNITGFPSMFNDIMNERFQTQVMFPFGIVNQLSSSVLIDEVYNDGNASHVIVNKNQISNEILASGVSNFIEGVFYGNGIKDIYQGTESGYIERITGNTSTHSYTVNENYTPTFPTNERLGELYWIFGRQALDSLGKTVAVGSTIMFSDLIYDSETNTKWIDAKDNKALFQNIIAYLLQLTPVDATATALDYNFGFFVLVAVGGGLSFSLLLFVLIFGFNIFTRKIKIQSIFQFRQESVQIYRKGKTKVVKTAKSIDEKKKDQIAEGAQAHKKRRKRSK